MRVAAIVVLGALFASPASAAGWMSCSDSGGLASFDYLSSAGPDAPFTVTAVTVTVGERVWASDPANGPGDPIYVGRHSDESSTVFVDGIDDAYNAVAELRLFKAGEADATVYGGTLSIPGVGAWAVSCAPAP